MGCEVIGEATVAGDDHGALVRPVSTSALLRDRPARSSAVKRAAVLTADQISAMLAAASPRDAALGRLWATSPESETKVAICAE